MNKRLISFALAIFCLVFAPSALAASSSAQLEVSHPDKAGDGEAFAVFIAAGPEISSVRAHWRGKELDVPLEPGGDKKRRAGQFLLSVPLDCPDEDFLLEIMAYSGKNETAASFRRVEKPGRLSAAGASAAASAAPYKAHIKVTRRAYPVQELGVEPKYVDPPEEMTERIEKERKEMKSALEGVMPQRLWGGTTPMLKRPVPGTVSSPYGVRRVFNGQPRDPHKGLDLRGATGVKIQACAEGVVVLAADYYYAGKIVVLEHGLGVKTVYMHMSALNVKKGDRVKAGEIVGLVGKTGRVTGPHLHLALYVLGEYVNPEPFIPAPAKKKK